MSQPLDAPEDDRPQGMSEFTITVLLVDDQKIIGEAIRRMLDGQDDIDFHFCQDPTQALEMARQIKPTVILQDLVMPEVDGLTLVKFFRANASTRDTPIIVLSTKEESTIKADAFALGANDYLVKLPEKPELLARIRYHSRGYINLLQRNEAYSAIEQSRQHLAQQMEAAAKYVSTLLPEPTNEPVDIDWRYIPCTDLGGDTFGYHWIDSDNFAFYLIDVSGHGLDSALLSVTIMNVLRSRSLPQTDFRDPGQVLLALNNGFPMEEYGGKFFTIWYGVFDLSSSTLSWCGGGHPPALLLASDPSAGEPILLDSDGPMIGGMPWDDFETQQHAISSGNRLFIYSDGVHEIHQQNGVEWPFEEFVDYLAAHSRPGQSPLDELLKHVRQINGSDLLDDDFSIIEVGF